MLDEYDEWDDDTELLYEAYQRQAQKLAEQVKEMLGVIKGIRDWHDIDGTLSGELEIMNIVYNLLKKYEGE
jgi:hypothetical protein